MLVVIGKPADDDPWKTFRTLQANEPIAKNDNVEQQCAGPVCDKIAPVFAAGRLKRGEDDLEVFGVIRVGLNNQSRLAIQRRMMLDAVADALFAGLEKTKRCRRASSRSRGEAGTDEMSVL